MTDPTPTIVSNAKRIEDAFRVKLASLTEAGTDSLHVPDKRERLPTSDRLMERREEQSKTINKSLLALSEGAAF